MSEVAPPKPFGTGPRCIAPKKDGSPCPNAAGKGGSFCYSHDPHRDQERAENRKKGGLARQKRLNEVLEGALPDAVKAKLISYDEVRELLADTVHHVRTGQLSTDRANAIASLCRVILTAKNDGKLDEKLKDLESRTRVLKNVSATDLLEMMKAHATAKANGATAEH